MPGEVPQCFVDETPQNNTQLHVTKTREKLLRVEWEAGMNTSCRSLSPAWLSGIVSNYLVVTLKAFCEIEATQPLLDDKHIV